MANKHGLGRGLESLFNENSVESEKTVELRLSEIEPNKSQPRKVFNDEALAELSDSIAKHGLLQPIVVRPMVNGGYQIVAGERRWRACRMAGLTTATAIVKDLDDKEAMELALIENLQRQDLNPVEEAFGYRTLMEDFSFSQEQVAERVGKSRSAVANILRLLYLDTHQLIALSEGRITSGHARALLSIEDQERREKAFNWCLNGASVRQIEAMAKGEKAKKKDKKAPSDSFYSEVELAMKAEIRRKVSVKANNKGKGSITIEFYNKEELADIAARIAGSKW